MTLRHSRVLASLIMGWCALESSKESAPTYRSHSVATAKTREQTIHVINYPEARI